MAALATVDTFQGRLDTFAVPHQLAKRRASSASRKKGAGTVSWPHKAITPNDLARAGFFYQPTSEAEDNCECFLCHVKLDGWEDGDDPIEEHLKHSSTCGWAISASIQRKFDQGATVDADPLSEELIEARTHTFGDRWPHESKKGWKPKIKKMVLAGWSYDPSPEYDDGTTCMYCNLSLDGWEPKDDPYAEHERRCPECPFFSLVSEWASARRETKSRTTKSRTSRGSKASRLSTQSTMSVASEAPSHLSLGDLDGTAMDEDSVLTTATTSSKTGKGRKKAAPKAPKKSTRTKKTTASQVDDSAMDIDQPTSLQDSTMSELPTKPTKKRTTRTKKIVVAEDAPIADVDVPVAITEDAMAVEDPPKRQTRRKASRSEQPSQLEDILGTSQSQRPIRGQKAGKAKEQLRMSEDESQLHMELQAAIDESVIPRQTSQPKRGVKRTSDGVAKIESSIVMLDEQPADFPSSQPKAKRGRPRKTASQGSELPTQIQRSSNASEESQRHASNSKIIQQPKKGRKAAKESLSSVRQPRVVAEPALVTEDPFSPVVDEADIDFDFAQSLVNPANPYGPITGTPDHALQEASPAPSTPTPVRVRDDRVSSGNVQRSAKQQESTHVESTTPVSSPNSSDAENKPPSSRPASARPPLSTQRIPLATGTPNRQLMMSPSKRTMGGLKTQLPWSPTDLENIFMNSPVKRNLGLDTTSSYKESALSMQGTDIDRLDDRGLREVVSKVKQALEPEQKKMTVEQWVRWNAEVGEERLRQHCEGMVMLFEKEAGRAMQCLEGVECLP